MNIPAQLPGETDKAYDRFCRYVSLGADRSIAKLLESMGRSHGYLSTLKGWSTRWDWVARARAFDRGQLQEEIAGRQDVIEQIRNRAIAKWPDRIAEIERIAEHGEKESVRFQANKFLMELGGATITKRVELSGPDGETLAPLAAAMSSLSLSVEQIDEMMRVASGGVGDAD